MYDYYFLDWRLELFSTIIMPPVITGSGSTSKKPITSKTVTTTKTSSSMGKTPSGTIKKGKKKIAAAPLNHFTADDAKMRTMICSA